MKVWKWIGTASLAVALAGILVSCSSDPGNLTAPVDPLERSVYDSDELVELPGCDIVAKDIFANGGTGMPFEMDCENMANAQSTVTRMRYDRNNCLVEVQGWVRFSDTGHRFSYTATTRGCDHDGGKLMVCSILLGGCREVNLPVALSAPTTVRGAAK